MKGFVGNQALKIIDSTERRIRGIISAEVLDSRGTVIVQSDLFKALDAMLRRGMAPMMLEHAVPIIGEWTKFWRTKLKIPTTGMVVDAVMGDGQLYRDMYSADQVWEQVKNGELTGISMHSGALRSQGVNMKNETRTVMKPIESYEVSLCKIPSVSVARILGIALAAQSDVTLDPLVGVTPQNPVVQCDDGKCTVLAVNTKGVQTQVMADVPTTDDDKIVLRPYTKAESDAILMRINASAVAMQLASL